MSYTIQTITPREMQLGDVIRNGDSPFSDCTVKQIKDNMITLFRPYVHTSDFSYVGGIITYIGIEEYKISVDSDVEYQLIQRVTLR